MKHFLIIIAISLVASSVKGQILNGGLEEWIDGKPVGWTTISSSSIPFLDVAATRDSNSHSGKYCFTVGIVGFGSGPEGILLSNSTSSNPSGAAIVNRSSISFGINLLRLVTMQYDL